MSFPPLTLERVQVGRGWIYLEMTSGDAHYSHTLTSRYDKLKGSGIITGYGQVLTEQPQGKTTLYVMCKTEGTEYGLMMVADSELIQRHWEDFGRLLRNARRNETRKAKAAA